MKITREMLRVMTGYINNRLPITLRLVFVDNKVRVCKETETNVLINLSQMVSYDEMSNILDTIYALIIASKQ